MRALRRLLAAYRVAVRGFLAVLRGEVVHIDAAPAGDLSRPSGRRIGLASGRSPRFRVICRAEGVEQVIYRGDSGTYAKQHYEQAFQIEPGAASAHFYDGKDERGAKRRED